MGVSAELRYNALFGFHRGGIFLGAPNIAALSPHIQLCTQYKHTFFFYAIFIIPCRYR